MTFNSDPIRSILERKYWIFDLDGTLTVPVHNFPAIRVELGIPEGKDILKFILAQDKSTASSMLDKLNRIEIDLAEQTEPAEGVEELINLLHTNCSNLGIITRNTKENAQRSLKKIGILPYFSEECILGRQQAPPKPNPFGILHMLSLWNATPDQAVMVGDYVYDLQAGKAAGTATIHVDHEEQTSWNHLTDIHVSSLLEIVGMFATCSDFSRCAN